MESRVEGRRACGEAMLLCPLGVVAGMILKLRLTFQELGVRDRCLLSKRLAADSDTDGYQMESTYGNSRWM